MRRGTGRANEQMTSAALQTWNSQASSALDEIVAAHRAVTASGLGQRSATREITHAYAVLLSSQFQRFCRDIHTEAVEFVVAHVPLTSVANLLRARMLEARKLDRGNPNPGNLGSDFARLGMDLWEELKALSKREESGQAVLRNLTEWRNAIAHQDFRSKPLHPAQLRHDDVDRWRKVLNELARSFDEAISEHVHELVGSRPW